jgi:hypothetical protein
MVTGVSEGGGREATVNRTDGLGHCEEEWYMW